MLNADFSISRGHGFPLTYISVAPLTSAETFLIYISVSKQGIKLITLSYQQ